MHGNVVNRDVKHTSIHAQGVVLIVILLRAIKIWWLDQFHSSFRPNTGGSREATFMSQPRLAGGRTQDHRKIELAAVQLSAAAHNERYYGKLALIF